MLASVTYRFSRKAAEDIDNIYVVGVQAFGVQQVERYFAGLIEALEFLSAYPRAARARPELGPHTRAHPYRAHLIFYRLDGADVFIQRIRHGSEDWMDRSAQE